MAASDVLAPPQTKEATINEIRTQRLAQVLRAMNTKASSVPRIDCPNRVVGVFLFCDHLEENETEPNMAKRGSLTRTFSGSTISTVDSLIRCQTSTISRKQFRSLRIAISRESSLDKQNDTNNNDNGAHVDAKRESAPELSPPALACEKLGKFARQFVSKQSSGDPDKPARVTSQRARTIASCTRPVLSKSPSPSLRIRAETDGGAKSRKISFPQTSKNGSTGPARSLSPMPSLLGFTGGMLGSISSDQPISPGSPVSPSYMDGKYTVLVVGSKGVGKSALIHRFMREDCRKGAPRYDAGSTADDNCVKLLVDNEESQLRFIEVNNQRSDLWLSLSGAAYIVMYNCDDTASFRNATEIVARLRKRNDSSDKPIMLVSNKQSGDRKRFVIANDDGRQVAKQNHCKFYEIYVGAGRSATDLLIGTVQEIRCRCLHRQTEQARPTDIVNEDGNPATHCFDRTNSVILSSSQTSHRASAASSTSSVGSKGSSLSGLGQKLWWSRKKVKECKSAEAAEELRLASLHNWLLGERRGSRSLEALPLMTK